MGMGKVETVAHIVLDGLPPDIAQRLELVVGLDGAHTNSWSYWSFPRNGLLQQNASPVYSTVKWAGINRLYPFVQQGPPPPGGNALLVTPVLDATALEHLRAGGRVWLMAERGGTEARSDVAFFPASGGALGTLVRDHPALQGFPHEGFGDLQFFNLMDGAVPLPLDKWPAGFQPIIGGIRTTASFLSKSKDLSRVGYLFEAKVGAGRLLVTSLRFRDHFDEAYPEAIYLFDRLLRYTTGPAFAPTVEAGQDELEALMPPR